MALPESLKHSLLCDGVGEVRHAEAISDPSVDRGLECLEWGQSRRGRSLVCPLPPKLELAVAHVAGQDFGIGALPRPGFVLRCGWGPS
jgi:hypothetical protein